PSPAECEMFRIRRHDPDPILISRNLFLAWCSLFRSRLVLVRSFRRKSRVDVPRYAQVQNEPPKISSGRNIERAFWHQPMRKLITHVVAKPLNQNSAKIERNIRPEYLFQLRHPKQLIEITFLLCAV